MTYKRFRTIKIITGFIVGVITAQAIIFDNYFLAVVAVFSALAVIGSMKKKVVEVINDERDYAIAGNAARLSLSLFSLVGALLAFAFMSLRNVNSDFMLIGSTLAYSVCALLIFHRATSAIYGKQN
ncbi:MAG: DUF2178 domain-containing protein [Patescibacteria group bacterium]|nr:DUF2178 domain-containing protein [Patescibacteria group bacterium]